MITDSSRTGFRGGGLPGGVDSPRETLPRGTGILSEQQSHTVSIVQHVVPVAHRTRVVLAGLMALVITAGCSTGTPDPTTTTHSGSEPARLRVRVLDVLEHDPEAFTQGFELADGTLYEGTGQRGESAITAGPPGEPPDTRVQLPDELFGEGITVVDDHVWQLTWKAGIAIRRDRTTLTETDRSRYSGEGWGLCYQPERDRLVMSDGSATLTFRDPQSFTVLGRTTVRNNGEPVQQLNELECVADTVYANVWQTDTIMRVEPDSGRVSATIDASGLLSPSERGQADVLNGIAAAGSGEFLLTGKHWPNTYRVRFVPKDS